MCEGQPAFGVELGTTAARCISHGDVSAVAKAAYDQIRSERMGFMSSLDLLLDRVISLESPPYSILFLIN